VSIHSAGVESKQLGLVRGRKSSREGVERRMKKKTQGGYCRRYQ
jgi:hypothetical protein